MLIRVRIAFGVFCVAALFLVSGRAQELTEEEAVSRFLTRSPSALESRAGTAVVEAQARNWHLWPNPQAGFDHEGAGLEQGGGVQQTVPLNGRLGLRRQAGIAAVQAAGMQAEYNVWKLCSDMRQAFYDLLLAQRREELLRDSLGQLQEVVRILEEREKHGEGSLFDRLRAEQELADLRADIASAQALTALARPKLAAFFDSDIDPLSIRVRGEFAVAQELPLLTALLHLAILTRQDYKAERQVQEQFRFEERAAARRRIPDPVFFAGFKRESVPGGFTYGPRVGVGLSLPIFDRGQTGVAEMQAELRRSEYRQAVLERQVEAEVAGAYQALEVRRRAAEEYRFESDAQSVQLERIAQLAYAEDELGILELLDAYRVRRQSRLRTLELTAAAKQAEIDLERVVGTPVLNEEVLP